MEDPNDPIDPQIIFRFNDIQNHYSIASIIGKNKGKHICIGFLKPRFKKVKTVAPKNRFALKFIKFSPTYTAEDLERERLIIHQLERYDKFIKYGEILSVKDKECDVIVPMNYYYYTDMFNHTFKKGFVYDDTYIKSFAFQGFQILKILKDHKICHFDIKLENFIVKESKPLQIILTDFENAEQLMEDEYVIPRNRTACYSAPEVLQQRPCDFSADMWSFGVAIYAIQFQRYPFQIEPGESEEVILNKILTNPLMPIENNYSRDVWECLTQIFVLDPSLRLTPENAFNLKLFEGMVKRDVKTTIKKINDDIGLTNEINGI